MIAATTRHGCRERGTPDDSAARHDDCAGRRHGSESWQVAALELERFLALRMSLDLRLRLAGRRA